jgi:two-component system nitrogen regulation response regulator GlnG
LSRRRAGPFVAVNCAAVVETLLEAELFGIEERTATGVRGRRGKFEHADGGTLFLDEVSDLSLSAQAKLLRAIQDLAVERVGGTGARRVDTRIVVATNKPLSDLVGKGLFRADLFYRLSGVEIHVPPLRERREDLPRLIRHFIQIVNAKLNRSIRGVDDQALKRLQEHAWPGNVRELERVLTRAAILVGGEIITANDLSFLNDSVFTAGTDGMSGLERAVRAALREALVDSPAGGSVFYRIVDGVETAIVREALAITNGNQVKASELLGLNRATLRKKAPAE